MSPSRRQLFKMLPIAGVAVPASKLLPESVLQEINPKKRYLLKLSHPIPNDVAENFSQALQERGLDNITVIGGDFELFELEA